QWWWYRPRRWWNGVCRRRPRARWLLRRGAVARAARAGGRRPEVQRGLPHGLRHAARALASGRFETGARTHVGTVRPVPSAGRFRPAGPGRSGVMRAQTAPPGEEVLGPFQFYQLIGRQGPSGPRLRCPMDIAVDDAVQTIYVISRIEPRVARWSFDGDFVDD